MRMQHATALRRWSMLFHICTKAGRRSGPPGPERRAALSLQGRGRGREGVGGRVTPIRGFAIGRRSDAGPAVARQQCSPAGPAVRQS